MTDFLDIHTHDVHQEEDVRRIYNWAPTDADSVRDAGFGVSCGIHPWFLSENELSRDLEALELKLRDPAVKMIGECGFDKLKGPALSLQKNAFEAQLALAVRYDKPMVIHCVRAFDELISSAAKYCDKVPMIIHGYSKSFELAQQLSKQGFYLSFGHGLFRENSGATAFLQQHEGSFFLETDDADVSIKDIYKKAAILRQISEDQLKDAIFAHWKILKLI